MRIAFFGPAYSMNLWFLVLFCLASITGCQQADGYSGEGVLLDHGSLAATNRFELRLGKVDLATAGERSFRLIGLPRQNFVIGLEIAGLSYAQVVAGTIDAEVSFVVVDRGGNSVAHHQSSLKDLVWSSRVDQGLVFGYGRGESGTYFDASSNQEYSLIFAVVQPDAESVDFNVELTLKSQGWK